MVTEIQRTALIQAIGQMMSDLSEECYAASWLIGWEFQLPYMYYERPQNAWMWGMWEDRADYSDELHIIVQLVELAGTWAMWNCDAPHMPEYFAFDPRPFIQATTLEKAIEAADVYTTQFKEHPETLKTIMRDALHHMIVYRSDWFPDFEAYVKAQR